MDLIEAVHQQQASPQLRAYAIYFYYFYGFKKAKIAGLFHKSKTTISTLINDYEEGKGLCRKDYQQTFRRFDQLKRDWLIAQYATKCIFSTLPWPEYQIDHSLLVLHLLVKLFRRYPSRFPVT